MFTGIIQTVGKIKDIERKSGFARVTIEHNGNLSAINTGDSVAVDGACLTVVDFSPSVFRADISGETLRLTTLGNINAGEKVNLEKSLTPSTPLGGHFVTGHIDGIGFIKKKTISDEFAVIDFNIPGELQGQLAKKGSVAVDGISLTVVDIFENGFRTAVIPHTLRDTTLSGKTKGDNVNIETDIIAKYVQRFLLTYNKQGIDETFLKGHGFIEG
ncbi:MAG: riboflavin synthase [Deltaproteobacteria bacterium]|nr:riboflavin synthase [Deltaproteobacteria bacterium]